MEQSQIRLSLLTNSRCLFDVFACSRLPLLRSWHVQSGVQSRTTDQYRRAFTEYIKVAIQIRSNNAMLAFSFSQSSVSSVLTQVCIFLILSLVFYCLLQLTLFFVLFWMFKKAHMNVYFQDALLIITR
jgi:hypothetical protein